MSRNSFIFDPVERFISGTVGQPGERTFFVQARTGTRLISVALEKTQLEALALRIQEILREVRTSYPGTPIDKVSRDDAPLENPIEEEFRVGMIGLAYDPERTSIEIDFQSVTENDQFQDDGLVEIAMQEQGDLLRVVVTLGVAQSFALRSLNVIGAGRKPCPFCGGPLDPRGHLCPRANGYRR
jgi:uncharacterized repeat protein (TIGR03847 family)